MKIHFIGIGGIGVSALARYYLAKGYSVSGSDLTSSEITQALEKEGVKIHIGKHSRKNLPKGVDLIIYSPAVKKSNPEFLKSKAKSYPQALGELTKNHFTIAVAGTHGKSTTTAMIGIILAAAGLDPTVIVGTKVKEFKNSNCRIGKSKYLVIEACEYDSSFLNYWPDIAVITNIEAEHLDYFKNFSNVLKAFESFVGKLPKNGILINEEKYKNRERAERLKKVLKIPGEHNINNALAALAVALALGIHDKIAYRALSKFKGSWRRFDVRKIKNLTVVSDYGHHPTEIKATLEAARQKWPQKKIVCVFQPHQYQRTYYFFKDFVRVFSEAKTNKIIITDIYDVAGREQKNIKEKVSSEKLAKAVKKKTVLYLPKKDIIPYLKKKLKGDEVLIIMGAGDIYEVDKALQ